MDIKEKILLDAIKNGNSAAFEQLFKNHYAMLCIYAKRYVITIETAEEIVQDIFIKLWEKRNMIDVETSLLSYLYRSVYNTCMNYIKHQKVQKKFEAYTQIHTNTVEPAFEYNDPLNPKDIINEIKKAVNELPEQCKKIFTMCRIEGMKYQEVAESLNLSVKTVEAQMCKAFKVLRERFKSYNFNI